MPNARRTRPASPRRAWRAAAAVLIPVLVLAAAGPASAAEARDLTAFACPPAEVSAPFTDTSGNVHAFAIDCLFTYGLAQGTTATTYGPRDVLTRGQAARVLYNLLDASGVAMDTAARGFTDVAGNPHEDAINGIASVRVAYGTSATRFEPGSPLSRAQLASLIIRTLSTTGVPVEIGPDAFDDDTGSTHEQLIDAVAHNGIFIGVGGRRFEPGQPVRRDAMASVVMRAVDFGIEHGGVPSAFEANQRVTALTPGQVAVPGGGEPDASGAGAVWTIGQPDVVCYEMVTRDVGSGQDQPERGAYLAAGAAGAVGDVLVELPPPGAANDIPFSAAHAAAAGCVRTDPAVVTAVVDGPDDLYLGLATADHVEALRGQLGAPEEHLAALLTGAAEVPGPGDPDGSGRASVTTTSQGDQVCWSIEVAAIGEVTAAHVHAGAAGVAGPPVVTLAPTPGDDGVVAWCTAGVAADVLAAMVAAPGDHYVNVHTPDHPAGAVRGQLSPAPS